MTERQSANAAGREAVPIFTMDSTVLGLASACEVDARTPAWHHALAGTWNQSRLALESASNEAGLGPVFNALSGGVPGPEGGGE